MRRFFERKKINCTGEYDWGVIMQLGTLLYATAFLKATKMKKQDCKNMRCKTLKTFNLANGQVILLQYQIINTILYTDISCTHLFMGCKHRQHRHKHSYVN